MGDATMFPSFAEFFHGVHGVPPYRWQEEAANYAVRTGRLPLMIDVPTGLGKTALADVWVWALGRATAADLPHQLGQRYVHAVERRAVVDGADAHVRQLQRALLEPSIPALRMVSDALLLLAAEGAEPLGVTSFHGSRRDDRTWLDRPRGATIITTTVTQLVLRVLGHAPGVTPNTAIIHTGLISHDAAWVVDEPHLSTVMVDTLRQVSTMANTTLTCLGATIPDHLVDVLDPDAEDTIQFLPEQETSGALERYNAPRLASIVCSTASSPVRELVKQAARAHTETSRSIVFVNTVQTASDVAAALAKKLPKTKVRLVTSRVRMVDRDEKDLAPKPGELVVSTQCLEAGVDFEVDLLVTQVSAWPSLVQRMGRLNRYGGSVHPQGILVVPKNNPDKGSQAVYGEEILANVCSGLRALPNGADFSLGGIPSLKEAVLGDNSAWPEPVRMGQMDAEYAALMLVAPAPHATSLWLRGLDQEEETAPVAVLWRDVLDEEILEAAPPTRGEQLELSIHLARGLAAGHWNGEMADTDDADNGYKRAKREPTTTTRERLEKIRIRKAEGWCIPQSLWDIAPGSTIVLHTSLGGYLPDRGVWVSDAPVEDVHASTGEVEIIPLPEECAEMTPQQIGRYLDRWVVCVSDKFVVSRPREQQKRRETSSGILTLVDHCRQTSGLAEQFIAPSKAESSQLKETVVQAAGLHDLGKAHPSFQAYLGAQSGDCPLAKSTGRNPLPRDIANPVDHAAHGARIVAAYCPENPLVAHLVESHHGYRGTADYLDLCGDNPWFLAWAETMVRLADWKASAEPDPHALGPVTIDDALLDKASHDIDDPAQPFVDLTGLGGSRVGAWYATVGIACAAEEVTGRQVSLSWPEGLAAPRLHGVSESDLPAIAAWFTEAFVPDLERWEEDIRSATSGLLTTKNHRCIIPDLRNGVRCAHNAAKGNRVLSKVSKHLFSANMPLLDGGKTELSGGWLAANGIVFKRIQDAPPVSVEMMLHASKGWQTSPELGASDHLLDRLSDTAPDTVRVEEYLPITVGIAVSGRPLAQHGVAHLKGRKRFLPRPTYPVSLWTLEVLSRRHRGSGLMAEEVTRGKFKTVAPPVVV